MTLYFITGNPKKFKEAKAILPEIEQLELDLEEIQSMDPKEVIKAKLKEATKHHSGPFFCEDVSLSFKALNGFPGPFVKFWNAKVPSEKVVQILDLFDDKSAKVTCTIGYFDKDNTYFFEGIVEGEITSPRGDNKFGFDPIFMPNGYSKTFAQMDEEGKNQVSHRYLALMKLKEFLDSKQE